MKRLDFLRMSVALMRELGVMKWAGIELGPDPHAAPAAPSDEEIALRRAEAARRHHDIMFASSSSRPPLPGMQGRQNGPKSVVPRGVPAPGRRHDVST